MTRLNFTTLILTVMLFMTSINYCYAGAALKITPMQSSITGVIATKAEKRGFAANDPRFAATLDAITGNVSTVIGTTAGAGATALVLAGVTAPAWGTIALAAGVGAVVTIGVTLAVGGLINWMFSPDPSVQNPITQSNVGDSSSLGGLVAGQPYWSSDVFKSSDPMAAIHAAFNKLDVNGGGYTYSLDGCTTSATQVNCSTSRTSTTDHSTIFWGYQTALYSGSAAPRSCPKGQLSNATACVALPVYTTDPNPQAVTAQQALDHLSDAEKAKPLNPALLAAIADKLWQDAAAKPNYAGLPYIATDPITTNDAKTYQDANPTRYPTVGDFVNPQTMADSPFTLPHSSDATTQDATNPATGINPAAANPLTNLGTDPVIGNPTIEDTPTALSILQPILSMFPDFKTFVVPSHSSVCPTPTFNIFGKSIVMDAQCSIANDQRPALYAIMAVVWLIAGAIIVLRA